MKIYRSKYTTFLYKVLFVAGVGNGWSNSDNVHHFNLAQDSSLQEPPSPLRPHPKKYEPPIHLTSRGGFPKGISHLYCLIKALPSVELLWIVSGECG